MEILSVVVVIVLVIVLLWMAHQTKSENFNPLMVGVSHGSVNYVRLYEDFNWNDLLYELTNSSSKMKYLKYAIKAPVKSIDINLPNPIISPSGESVKVELWNVRQQKGLESSQSDFYENTIYTTLPYLRHVTGNLTKLAEVGPGQSLKIANLPPVKKILIVARL